MGARISFPRSLKHAPADDEPLSAQGLGDLEEALTDCAAGRLVSHEEARRHLLGEE